MLNFSAFFIRRPAFTIVLCLLLTIIGIISYMDLPVKWLPDVTQPEVTISTPYPGASAIIVERDVTKIIEEVLSGINGIESLTSSSNRDLSTIYIKFKLGLNMNAVVDDVRSSIERIRGQLPRDADSPAVIKSNSGGDAILYLSFFDRHRSQRELSDYVDHYIVPLFDTIDGVGKVDLHGKRKSALHVWLDPNKMAAANITVDELSQLLHEQNASIPSGQILAKDKRYTVIMDTSLKSAEEFSELIIKNNHNKVIKLKDVAEVKLDVENNESLFRINGRSGVALAIVPQATANPLEVEKGVKKVFAELKHTLPTGLEGEISYNRTDYIRASIHSVYESIFEAILFVWLIILAFLCSFRATIIPIITIPVCLISSFAILYYFGFSINTITLMAFVLAIGLVVDDAIVVLENISRYREEGLSSFDAALKGSREILFSVIAMTITLAAVYAPIAFTPGLLGVLFKEFTFTLAGTVLISGLIAITLTPMMCARFLKKMPKPGRYSRWQQQFFQKLVNHYQYLLSRALKKRALVLGGLLVLGILGGSVYHLVPSELAPAEDMNILFMSISAPRNASFDYTQPYLKELEKLVAKTPEISSFLSIINSTNPNHAFQVLILKPREQRQASATELMLRLSSQVNVYPGVRVSVFTPPPPLAEFADSENGDNMGLVLMTTGSYENLQSVAEDLSLRLKEIKGFSYVGHSYKLGSEQLQVNIDRDRAADLQVSIPVITNTLSSLIAGRKIGKTDEMNILLQLNKSALANPNIIQTLYVRNAQGQMLPLSSMLEVSETAGSEGYKHYSRMRSDTIYMTLKPDFKVFDAIGAVEKIAKDNLPKNVKFTFSGEAKSFIDSNGKTFITFLLALIFIYLVLVAQFESFIDPLIILFTVPFAMVGAILTLKMFNGTFNIYSNIGLITLVGLIAKHGILITDFANRLREQGLSIQEAVIKAAQLRLRPILMTTLAMVLGALPLAFAFGPGAESRQQIGLVIVGGMLLGTFFSLIVVPIVYTYLAPFRRLNIQLIEQEVENAVRL